MKFKVNLNDVGGGFEPIPVGDYTAYLYDAQAKTFNTGSQGYRLTFKIADGQYQGRQVFDNLVLVETAKWKIAQFWKAMTNEMGEVEVDTDKIPEFIGRKIGLKIGVENDNQGNPRNVVKSMYYVGGREPVSVGPLGGALDFEEGGRVDINDGDYPF